MSGQSAGLRVAVTGAAGFLGRAVIERIERGAIGASAELRLNDVRPFAHRNASVIQGSYADSAVREQLIQGGIDVLFHLACLAGGASERDPVLGKLINLDGSIALFDLVARTGGAVVVYSSSIAVFGMSARPVDDGTALRPSGSYGTHKAMIELYLADLTRRGVIDGRAIRLAGIVARPRDAYAGFATAWMSDLFHAAIERRDITITARAGAQIWLQSVDVAADNIIHAALMPAPALSPQRAWTLPATVVRVESLVDALRRRTGYDQQVEYGVGPTDLPPLNVPAALAIGFVDDGDIDALVDAVVSRIAAAPTVEALDGVSGSIDHPFTTR